MPVLIVREGDVVTAIAIVIDAKGNVVEGENRIIGETIESPDDRVGSIIGDDGKNLAIQRGEIKSGIEFTAGDGVAA